MNNNKFKIAVGDLIGVMSEIWTFYVRKSDVYIAAIPTGKVTKISLHASGICQAALYEPPVIKSPSSRSPDRTIVRWRRGKTPDKTGLVAFRICFANMGDWVAAELAESVLPTIRLISPPPFGFAADLAVLYSRAEPLPFFPEPGDGFLWQFQLANGDWIALTVNYRPFRVDLFEKGADVKGYDLYLFGDSLEQALDGEPRSLHVYRQEYEGCLSLYSLQNVWLS